MTVSTHRPRPALLLSPKRGEDVTSAIAQALAAHGIGSAWIVGQGTLDEVELREANEPPRTFATRCRIVAFDGSADAGSGEGALTLSATVARSSSRGAELLVGAVVRAVAGELKLLLLPLDASPASPRAGVTEEPERDAADNENAARSASRDDEDEDMTPGDNDPEVQETHGARPSEKSGRERARDDEAPPAPTDAATAGSPWAALAAASTAAAAAPTRIAAKPQARLAPQPPPPGLAPPTGAPQPPRKKVDASADIYPDEGDLLDHFAFGRCIVIRSDGEELLVQNPASGRTRTLRLSVLTAVGPTEEDGKRLFRLTQRRMNT